MQVSAGEISACLIVRNEQAFLDGCLESLAGIVDEIVVVDTGSADLSREIAQAHGARLIEAPWVGDFAAARNVGLEAARGEWILYIDADERLHVSDLGGLKSTLESRDAFAARLRFVVRTSHTAYWEYRLFRNDPRLRFRGAIHETIRPDLDNLRRSIGATVVDVPATIVHLGYDGDMVAKYRRNLPLLQQAVVTEPGRLYYWSDLALTLAGLGQVEQAIEACDRGLASQAASAAGVDAIGSMLAYTGADLRFRTGGDVLPVIERGLRLYPGNWSLHFLKARVLVDAGRHDEALAILSVLTRIDPDAICDDTLAHDRRVFGAFAHDLSGVALLRTGRRADAAAAFDRAAKAAPDDGSYRIKALALGPYPGSDGFLEKLSGVVTRQ